MPEKITSSNFESTLDYASLPKAKLLELYRVTITAHRNFFHLWQQAVGDQFGSEVCAELTAQVYPGLAAVGNDLKRVFHEELNFLWSIMPDLHHMLTFARYDASLLPETLDADLDVEALASESLLLLWNVSTLTYVMQTGRWTDALTARFGQGVALKLERSVWLDYGGAEVAPGEVGLVDAEFHLENPNHGWITHKRCPALDRFGESNKERLESSCVLCVIAMRLSGEMVDKGIRCRPASLPPYREPVGHACKWEYWK
ncbi:MAG: hypothetical protein JRG80_18995 [Deltaproteobacteria bacterium]|nr:hypothetical protein [Deltaproteobacteria bacterium]